jgi:hypothetical protein
VRVPSICNAFLYCTLTPWYQIQFFEENFHTFSYTTCTVDVMVKFLYWHVIVIFDVNFCTCISRGIIFKYELWRIRGKQSWYIIRHLYTVVTPLYKQSLYSQSINKTWWTACCKLNLHCTNSYNLTTSTQHVSKTTKHPLKPSPRTWKVMVAV